MGADDYVSELQEAVMAVGHCVGKPSICLKEQFGC